MASTIKLKNGSGAPLAGDLVQGEPALDLTNKRLYTEDSGGTVIEVGTNPTSLTIGGTALTATAAELNTLDGITATTAELNTLDGITATVTELNYTDGVTSNIQTQLNTKSPIASPTFTGTVTAPAVNVTGTVTADGLDVNGDVICGAGGDTSTLSIKKRFDKPASLNFVRTTAGSPIDASITCDANENLIISWSDVVVGTDLLFQTRDTTHLKIDDNGDVSLYEDTGTTAKFFWDASAERLGIGTTSPSQTLDVVGNVHLCSGGGSVLVGGTGACIIDLERETANYIRANKDGTGRLILGAGDYVGIATGQADGDFAQNERVRIDSSGNVGIGTSSPATVLHVYDDTTVTSSSDIDVATFESKTASLGGAGFKSAIRLQHTSDTDKAVRITAIQANDYSNSMHMGFEVSNSSTTPPYEAARIDSQGHLLVGKTSADHTTAGISLYGAGIGSFVRDGAVTSIFNRLTSDGTIAEFRKDGVPVGSIGVSSANNLTVGSSSAGHAGFELGNQFLPLNAGAASDGELDLGITNRRFKDLYLSGGVYLGGTGAANLLDDYEEGTWTPVIIGSTTAGTGTYTTQTGKYVKVGNLVHVVGYINVDTHTGTGAMRIDGLPFTSITQAGVALGDTTNLTKPADSIVTAATLYSSTKIRMFSTSTSSTTDTKTGLEIDTDFNLSFSLTYNIA